MKHRNESSPCINSRIFLALALFASLTSLTVQASPPANYYLVWSDEFAGSSLDTSKWVYWLYPGNYKNATLSQSAFSESGDHGVITTYTSGGTQFTTMLSTQGKFHARYGYFEANMQWADNTGMWSAFWLQSPTMGSYIGDPATGGAEIDTCEHRLQDGSANNINNQVQSNIHWDGYGSSAQSAGSGNYTDSTANLNSGFHKYGVLWTSSGYTFYVDDGQQKYTSSSGLSARTEFMILSSIVDDTDTTWAGTIPSAGYGSLASSSTKLAVDYVRYYAPNNMIFWTGGSSPLWSDSGNWISARTPASGNDIVFSMLSSGNFTTTLDQNLTVNSLSIWETSPLTINSNTLTVNAGIDLNSAYNDLTINSDMILGNANNWSIGSGRTVNIRGHLSGGHSLNLNGYGTAALYNTNTYTLGTFINRGTLRLVNTFGLGSTSVGTTVASGAQLQVYASFSCNQPLNLSGTGTSANGALRVSASANAVWTGAITLGNAASINLDGGTTLAINSTISGGHSLTLAGDAGSSGLMNGPISTGAFTVTKSGGGTWTLAGTNTFTGALNVDSASTSANDGALVIVSSNAVGSASAIQIQNNTGTAAASTLQLDGSLGSFAITQPIALSGRNNVVPAIENLVGSNLLSGGVTMNPGGFAYTAQSDNGTLTFGGGISSASTSTRTFTFQGNGNINVSGVIANGSATTFNLQKTGSGTLILAGANTYNGATTNNGGTLALAPGGSIANSTAIVLGNGAIFDTSQVGGFTGNAGQLLGGSGAVVGNVSPVAGVQISPGTGIGTLIFSNNLTLSGGVTNFFDLNNVPATGGGTNDLIVVAGNFNLSGTNTILITPVAGSLANGRYRLIQYSGTRTGGATNFTVAFNGFAPIATITVDDSVPNEIDLVVFANPANLTWVGDGSTNNWDIATTANWFNGLVATQFNLGDNVTFDDSSANRTVSLAGKLAAGSITIVGTGSYTFSGTGKITGASGLVKSNSATLTVLTTNNYSGPTVIGSGTLQVGNGTTSGTLGTGGVIDNGTLAFNHPDIITVASAISGSGAVSQAGTGTLNLSGNNSFSGGVTQSGGIINASNSASLGTGPVLLTNLEQQLIFGSGTTFNNNITIGGPAGVVATGAIKGPAAGSATLNGQIILTVKTPNAGSTTNGGAFDGGNTTGGLILNGPINSTGGSVHLRVNRISVSGGGAYNLFQDSGTVVLGANNGLATNSVLEIGSSAAGTLDLAGFSQTLNGLQKGGNAGTVGNSSTTTDSMLTISGITSNTIYGGTIQNNVSGGTGRVFLTVAGGTFTLSAANTFTGDTELTGGTLALSSSTALQNSMLNLADGDGGILNFTTLTAATLGGLEGSRDLTLTNNSGAAVTLTVGSGNTNTYTYSGSLTGSGSLIKTGTGTWILNGLNTFTGVLNADTAQPSTGNDGALRLASPGAISGAASIAIRNQNSASSTLQLDGSSGNLTLPQNISLNGRNSTPPAIENLTGDNVFTGTLSLGSGGNTYIIQADAGSLTFSGTIGIQALTSQRSLTFQGTGNILVPGVVTNGATFPTSVVKTGSGTLTLGGTNTYFGGTTNLGGALLVTGISGTNVVLVTGGTLGGNGVIRGAVTIQAGGTLAPGGAGGATTTLTINNSLALSGNTIMQLNKTAGTNDQVRGLSSVTYGGTLTLTNLSGALATNDVFKLFAATNYGGVFAGIIPATPAPGFAWNTNTLATDGTLRILQTISTAPMTITNLVSGGSLSLSWPVDHIGWRLQTQTNNLTTGLGTNWVDVAGSTATNQMSFSINPQNGNVFYRMIFP